MRTPLFALLATLAPASGLAAINVGDTCAGFFACTQTCPNDDEACFESCTPTTTGEVGEVQAVLACLEANCPTETEDALTACLDKHCRKELDVCFADATGTGQPCDDGLSFSGRCSGDLLEWCQQEERHQLDCTKRQSVCTFVEEVQSFDCVAVAREDEADPHLLGLAGLAACSAAGAGAAGAVPLVGLALALLGARRRRP